MKITGELTVRAPQEAVFKAVQDARFFASCIDGVEEVTEIDPTHYDAVLETRVAYMKFRFKLLIGRLISKSSGGLPVTSRRMVSNSRLHPCGSSRTSDSVQVGILPLTLRIVSGAFTSSVMYDTDPVA